MTNEERINAELERIAKDYRKLNAKQQDFAIKEIERTRLDIIDLLAEYATSDNVIKKQRLNTLLRELESIEKAVRENGMNALESIITESITTTTAAVSGAVTNTLGTAAISGVAFDKINRDAFRYVVNRFADDGLVLSDRVWRLAGEQRDALNRVFRSGIIRGLSVNQLVAEIRKVYDNETWKIRRLVVTEGATAQRVGDAYFAQESEVVKGLRIHRGRANVSTHKCTILSKEDRYGWGAGVFKPTDSEIYAPHVNCTSWYEYVLNDEYR